MQHLQYSKKQKKKPKVSILKAFKTIIWPKRKLVFIGLILIVFSRLSSLVAPLKIQTLLDDVIPNKDYEQLYSLLLIVGLAILVQAVTSFLLTRIFPEGIWKSALPVHRPYPPDTGPVHLPPSFFLNWKPPLEGMPQIVQC